VSCGGSRGASAWGGRGSALRRAVYERDGARAEVPTRVTEVPARRGGVWERDGGDVSRGLSARRALEEEEAGLLHPEVGYRTFRRPIFERRKFNLSDFAFAGWRRLSPLAPAKALRADASIPTRRHSSRAPRVTRSTVTATSKAPRSVAAAAEPQQAAAATTAVMTMAVTTLSISPAPTPVGGSRAVVVEVPDYDTPPPGWDQWGSMPAPAPEPPVGVLVMREDGCVMSGRPTDGA
jgi:hypothetical protein